MKTAQSGSKKICKNRPFLKPFSLIHSNRRKVLEKSRGPRPLTEQNCGKERRRDALKSDFPGEAQ